MTGYYLFDLLLSVSPALVAIGLALFTRNVIPSLAAGVFTGALVTHKGGVLDALSSFLDYLMEAVIPGVSSLTLTVNGSGAFAWGYLGAATPQTIIELDYSHLIITVFSVLVAATVSVMTKTGATRTVVGYVERLAKGPRGAMVAAWVSGGLVFFDDYANCLVVGNTMGPVADRFRVSRAKLAYIVDSTAAPVASLALVSTWVGAEVSWIHDELVRAGQTENAFSVFLSALPYRFYGIFTLFFVGAIALSGKDFGPMLQEEAKCRRDGPPLSLAMEQVPKSGNALIAILPVLFLVGGTFAWMWSTGSESIIADRGPSGLANAAIYEIIGASDSFISMLYGSLGAFLLSVVLAVSTRAAGIIKIASHAWSGVRPVMGALGILFMAWSLGTAMEATEASESLSRILETTATLDGNSDRTSVRARWREVVSEKITDESGPFWAVLDDSGTIRVGDALSREERETRQGTVALQQFEGHSGDTGPLQVGLLPNRTDDASSFIPVSGPPWFPAWLLPTVIFLLAAGTAFSTGTSFGTMAILLPLAIPIGLWFEPAGISHITLASTAAVLAGACLGDHASPISDTTVLSSIGAGVDLIVHVRTQLPYALSAGAISILFGYLPAGFGLSPWLLIPLGATGCILVVYLAGKRPESLMP